MSVVGYQQASVAQLTNGSILHAYSRSAAAAWTQTKTLYCWFNELA